MKKIFFITILAGISFFAMAGNASAADRYWVPSGSEIFSDTDNWSVESGGASGASVPIIGDIAYFDANSFSESGLSVAVTSEVLCHINTTNSLPFLLYITTDGVVSLLEELTGIESLAVNGGGSFTTNNFDVTVTDGISVFEASTANFGTSTINITGARYQSGIYFASDSIVDVGDATFNLSVDMSDPEDPAFFEGGGKSFGTVSINFPSSGLVLVFTGDNSFVNPSITGDGTVIFNYNGIEETQSITGTLLFQGNTPGGLDLNGYVDSPIWTINKASGTVSALNCTITNSTATGGATFNALTSSGNVDGGGNSGWNFAAANTYTVTFDSQGGGVVDSITDIASGDTITLPTAPTKTGYTFASWNTETDGDGTTFDGSTAVVGDATVYAQWTASSTDSSKDDDTCGNNCKLYKHYKSLYKSAAKKIDYTQLKNLKKTNLTEFNRLKAVYAQYKKMSKKEIAKLSLKIKNDYKLYKNYRGYKLYKFYKDKAGK